MSIEKMYQNQLAVLPQQGLSLMELTSKAHTLADLPLSLENIQVLLPWRRGQQYEEPNITDSFQINTNFSIEEKTVTIEAIANSEELMTRVDILRKIGAKIYLPVLTYQKKWNHDDYEFGVDEAIANVKAGDGMKVAAAESNHYITHGITQTQFDNAADFQDAMSGVLGIDKTE